MTLIWHIRADLRLDAAVAATPGRIGRFDLDGATSWIKRVDRPTLLNRVLKGPPRPAFRRDLVGLIGLAARGVPVPQVVAEGTGISGMTLSSWCGVAARSRLRNCPKLRR